MRWGHMGQVLWLSALLWPMLRVGKSKPANPMWSAEGREDTWTVGDEWRGCSGCGHVEMSGGTVIGTVRVEDWYIYSLNLHGTEGNVALQSRFGFVSWLVCLHPSSIIAGIFLPFKNRLPALFDFSKENFMQRRDNIKDKECQVHFVIYD